MVEPGQQGIREREAKVPASRAHPNYQDLPETLSSLLRDQDADPPTAPGYDPEDRRRTSRLRRRRRTPIKPRGTARLPTPKPSSPSHERGRACHTKSIVHHGSERRESIALIHRHGTATGPLQPGNPLAFRRFSLLAVLAQRSQKGGSKTLGAHIFVYSGHIIV